MAEKNLASFGFKLRIMEIGKARTSNARKSTLQNPKVATNPIASSTALQETSKNE